MEVMVVIIRPTHQPPGREQRQLRSTDSAVQVMESGAIYTLDLSVTTSVCLVRPMPRSTQMYRFQNRPRRLRCLRSLGPHLFR